MGLEQTVIDLGRKYVVTAAQANAPVNQEFYESLLTYCEVNGAELKIIPLQGRHVNEDEVHPDLTKHLVGRGDQGLGKHIKISDWVIKPQQMLPLTGLGRFTASDISSIFGSPKQHMMPVPNSNDSLPKVLMSTGVVTRPNYNEKFRVGQIARKDHTYGAIVVEVENNGTYHYRQLNSLVNGKFHDLGTLYSGSEVTEGVSPEAIVFGDIHALDRDPKVEKANLRMIKDLNPERVFLHDLFDGYSINHWNQGKIVELAKDYEFSGLNLEYELGKTSEVLLRYAEAVDGEVVVVASNHDERLHRWLQEGRFLSEPQNVKVASELLTAYLSGENPLEVGLRMYADLPDNVTFLTREDDYKVRGFQLGAHGDKGNNGARGSPRAMELAYGKSITAHSHSPLIVRNTYKVGTSTPLRLRYTQGPGSWMNTHAILYDTGKVQLVNVMRGKYFMGDKK